MRQRAVPEFRKTATRPVSAASALVILRRRVLLVRRAHPPLLRQWSLPGGRIAPGETAVAAIARELAEETGLKASRALPFTRVDVGRGRIFRIVCFRVLGWCGRARAADDALAIAWVPLRRVKGMIRHQQTLRVIADGAGIRPRSRMHCIPIRIG